MREILFRGKRVDNGEWVEGFYGSSGDKTYIIIDNDIAVGYFRMREVIPETVGQYTGLTDKNGKRIFEGDIVKQFFENEECEYDYSTFDIGIVFWKHGQAQFLRTSKLFQDDCPEMTAHCEYEVIGNIHDNPEHIQHIR